MANKRGIGSFSYKPSQGPTLSNGIGSLFGQQNQQQNLMGRSQAGQEQMGATEFPVGRTDPFTGARTETKEGMDADVQTDLRKKASEDAYKLSQAFKFVRSLRKDYDNAYKNVPEQSGIKGGVSAGKEYVTGVIGRKNDALRRYIDNLGASGVSLGKLGGDTGNFALQEQIAALKRLPKATPNFDITKGFMPDDPNYGKSKFDDIEQIFLDKMLEAQEVAKTGIPIGGYVKAGASSSGGITKGGIESERQKAIQAIQNGADPSKVAQHFLSKTGQKLNG